MGEGGTGVGISGFCGARSGRRRYAELPRGFDARGSWRDGGTPDLFGWVKTVPGRESPASAVRGRGGGDMLNFLRECWSRELGGWGNSRPLRMGEGGTVAGFSGFCGARSGRRRIFELPRVFFGRGSWRAGCPPDLPAREKSEVG